MTIGWMTIGWIAIGALLIGLVALALSTAARPMQAIAAGTAEQAAIWRRVHHADQMDPLANPLQRWFLQLTYSFALPLARRGVQPDVVTLGGLVTAGLALQLAWMGARWTALSAAVLIISSLLDGVDGAVAGLLDRTTLRGHVLDSVVDRVTEAMFVGALLVAGADPWSGGAAVAAIWLFEYTRARYAVGALRDGLDEVGGITIAERPTRVLACAFGLLGIAVSSSDGGRLTDEFIGTWSCVIICVLTILGLLQFFAKINRAPHTQ
jgi:phosphatidylglycerophosphate synthase